SPHPEGKRLVTIGGAGLLEGALERARREGEAARGDSRGQRAVLLEERAKLPDDGGLDEHRVADRVEFATRCRPRSSLERGPGITTSEAAFRSIGIEGSSSPGPHAKLRSLLLILCGTPKEPDR